MCGLFEKCNAMIIIETIVFLSDIHLHNSIDDFPRGGRGGGGKGGKVFWNTFSGTYFSGTFFWN